MNARRCAVALILGAAMAAAAAAGADEILDLGDGRVYRGEVLDGRPHGEGTMIWPSGTAYFGQWAHGARYGTGTYRDREGGVYADEYRDGERSGHSRFTWPNGAAYRQGTSRTRLWAACPGSAGVPPAWTIVGLRSTAGGTPALPGGACQEFGSTAEMQAPEGFWPSPTPRRCG